MNKISEHQLQNSIMQYLRMKGFYVTRMNSGALRSTDALGKMRLVRMHEAGTPDIMCFKEITRQASGAHLLMVKHPIIYFFEVKIGKNKPTRLQEIRMRELEGKGAQCYVVYSLEQVQEIIS